MRLLTLVSTAVAMLCSASANAAPMLLSSNVLNADAYQSAPLGITQSLAGPGGFVGGTIEGDILVTVPTDGVLSISVQDAGTPGNVFEVILDQTSLGTTAKVAAGGTVNSAGLFLSPVTAGDHDIGIWDYVLGFYGGTSPYGGTVGDVFLSPQPVQVIVSEIVNTTPVPEPSSLTLLGVTAFAACGLRFGNRAVARQTKTAAV